MVGGSERQTLTAKIAKWAQRSRRLARISGAGLREWLLVVELLWLGLVFFVELIVFLESLGGVFGAMGGDVGLSERAPGVGAVWDRVAVDCLRERSRRRPCLISFERTQVRGRLRGSSG